MTKGVLSQSRYLLFNLHEKTSKRTAVLLDENISYILKRCKEPEISGHCLWQKSVVTVHAISESYRIQQGNSFSCKKFYKIKRST